MSKVKSMSKGREDIKRRLGKFLKENTGKETEETGAGSWRRTQLYSCLNTKVINFIICHLKGTNKVNN